MRKDQAEPKQTLVSLLQDTHRNIFTHAQNNVLILKITVLLAVHKYLHEHIPLRSASRKEKHQHRPTQSTRHRNPE